jgi:rhomboid protease GluP
MLGADLGHVGTSSLGPLSRSGLFWWLPKATAAQLARSQLPILSMLEVGMFLGALIVGQGFAPPSENSTFGPSQCSLLAMGAKFAPFVVQRSEFWRLFTSVVLNCGLFTLLLNLALQYILMFPLEQALGALPIALVFWICGVLSNIFICVASPTAVGTGAGGALMGIVGFRLARDIMLWPDIPVDQRRRVGIIEIVSSLALVFSGISANVDNYAAFSGFVLGSFLGGLVFGFQLDAPLLSQRAVSAIATMGFLFIVLVWSVLLYDTQIPLIDQLVLASVCADNPSLSL